MKAYMKNKEERVKEEKKTHKNAKEEKTPTDLFQAITSQKIYQTNELTHNLQKDSKTGLLSNKKL